MTNVTAKEWFVFYETPVGVISSPPYPSEIAARSGAVRAVVDGYPSTSVRTRLKSGKLKTLAVYHADSREVMNYVAKMADELENRLNEQRN